ncbi:unnamed protein product [Sphagnum jensenii]|uniref:Trehalose 6-phosphate phosphatase n=1 Tax=Sphagnum jensenii TaxID=128206 RepID=A0ABP0XK17_9BRYO
MTKRTLSTTSAYGGIGSFKKVCGPLTINSGSLVSSPAVRSQPVLNVLQKKHNSSVTDKRHSVKWLDAMKAQSPPRFHSLHGDTPESYDIEAAKYAAWMKKHPSALSIFKEVMVEAKAKQVVVFLDYDGTLSPIVEDPDQAYMPNDMRVIVKEVAIYFPTAIISGRARPKVYEFVQLPELYYAGSHGMDIMGPANGTNGFKAKGTQMKDKMGNDVVLFQPASEYLPLMDEVCKILSESSKGIRGARVEHNRFCITMHFRCVKEESWGPLAEKVESVLKDYPTLCLTHGRKVLEIRPAIAWDKGKAVDFLLSSLGLSDCRDVFPVYIGDDQTDEDAFKVLNGLNHGCSILVTSVPKETKASFSLRDPCEVMGFLRHLVIWKEQDLEVHTGMGMVHRP